jgi:hypothetical protein
MKNSDSSVLSQFAPEGADIPLCGFDSGEKGKPLPKELRVTIEQLSGFDMSDVRVYYDSTLPEKFDARAFAYGTYIYLGPGAYETLPHEVWHVVQQKQGRVSPDSATIKHEPLNNQPELEFEADIMGGYATLLAVRYQDKPADFAQIKYRHRLLNTTQIVQPVIQPWIDITNDPNENGSKHWNSANAVLDRLNQYQNVDEDSHPGITYVIKKLVPLNQTYATYTALLADDDNVRKPLFGYQHENKMRHLMQTQNQLRDAYDTSKRNYLEQKESEHNQKYEKHRGRKPGFDPFYWNKKFSKTHPLDFFIWGRKTDYNILKGVIDPNSASTPFLEEILEENNPPFADRMNCWEAVLYSAYQARILTPNYILWAIQSRVCQFSDKYLTGYGYDPVFANPDQAGQADHEVPTFLHSIFQTPYHHRTILNNDRIVGTGVNYPYLPATIPRGQIVVFCGGAHVALSTGRRRQIANVEARGDCGLGHGILELDGDPSDPFPETIRETTIQDRIAEKGFNYGSEIWTGWLGDCPNTQLRIRYTLRRVREARRNYLVNRNIAASNIYDLF